MENVASFDKIIFSPGPALPEEAGLMMEVIERYHQQIPMFGVCLGFQAIVEFFGGELINFNPVRHGESKFIEIKNQENLFKGLGASEEVGLYHSWGINFDNMPKSLEVLAVDSENVVMAFKHRELPLFGVQFHPESVMTPNGNKMLENWINL
jgi:anthranilate synthase component 2